MLISSLVSIYIYLAGINQLEGVVILASTNRVDILDQVLIDSLNSFGFE